MNTTKRSRPGLPWLAAAIALTSGAGATASALPVLPPALTALRLAEAIAQDNLSADDLCEGLKGALKEKNHSRITGVIDLMVQGYAGFDEDGQKQVAKALASVLKARFPEGDDTVYVAAVASFAKTGPLGLKNAKDALKNKTVKDRPEVLCATVTALGAHKDRKEIETLVDFLVYKEPTVVAAAAGALGDNYTEEEEKVRKDVVGELVKSYANYASLAAANPREPVYAERLRVVERSMKGSLAKLTGVEQEDAVGWQRWYNDNKSKKWEDLGGGKG